MLYRYTIEHKIEKEADVIEVVRGLAHDLVNQLANDEKIREKVSPFSMSCAFLNAYIFLARGLGKEDVEAIRQDFNVGLLAYAAVYDLKLKKA